MSGEGRLIGGRADLCERDGCEDDECYVSTAGS